MLKKKKKLPLGVPDVWCEIWIQFFLFPQMGCYSSTIYWKIHLCLHIVLIFCCVDFYIVLKFISKDIVLLVLAVLNIFPIRRGNSLLLVHKKIIVFCLCICPIPSLNSLTLCSVLVDSLGFSNVPSCYCHIITVHNVFASFFLWLICFD